MTGPEPAELQSIVEDACTAASLHNTQPWRWTARADHLELWADWSRHLTRTDRDGRDLLISCGAALHTATVAAAGRGWATTVRRAGGRGELTPLATISFSPSEPTPTQVELLEVVRRRRTDRREVSSWSVPEEWVDRLGRIASAHGVVATGALQDDQQSLLARLLASAQWLQADDAGCREELATWTRTAAPEGIPSAGLPSAGVQARLGDALRRFPAGSLHDDYREAGRPAPSWMVLATSSDDPIAWLRAGEALAAVWIACTAGGLTLLPLSQAVEVTTTRRVLQNQLLDDTAYPQIVLRLGWPPLSRDVVPPTQRRPVDDVLDLDARHVRSTR